MLYLELFYRRKFQLSFGG